MPLMYSLVRIIAQSALLSVSVPGGQQFAARSAVRPSCAPFVRSRRSDILCGTQSMLVTTNERGTLSA
jgi:hypothetical protein